jgi:hypothetical protein
LLKRRHCRNCTASCRIGGSTGGEDANAIKTASSNPGLFDAAVEAGNKGDDRKGDSKMDVGAEPPKQA